MEKIGLVGYESEESEESCDAPPRRMNRIETANVQQRLSVNTLEQPESSPTDLNAEWESFEKMISEAPSSNNSTNSEVHGKFAVVKPVGPPVPAALSPTAKPVPIVTGAYVHQPALKFASHALSALPATSTTPKPVRVVSNEPLKSPQPVLSVASLALQSITPTAVPAAATSIAMKPAVSKAIESVSYQHLQATKLIIKPAAVTSGSHDPPQGFLPVNNPPTKVDVRPRIRSSSGSSQGSADMDISSDENVNNATVDRRRRTETKSSVASMWMKEQKKLVSATSKGVWGEQSDSEDSAEEDRTSAVADQQSAQSLNRSRLSSGNSDVKSEGAVRHSVEDADMQDSDGKEEMGAARLNQSDDDDASSQSSHSSRSSEMSGSAERTSPDGQQATGTVRCLPVVGAAGDSVGHVVAEPVARSASQERIQAKLLALASVTATTDVKSRSPERRYSRDVKTSGSPAKSRDHRRRSSERDRRSGPTKRRRSRSRSGDRQRRRRSGSRSRHRRHSRSRSPRSRHHHGDRGHSKQSHSRRSRSGDRRRHHGSDGPRRRHSKSRSPMASSAPKSKPISFKQQLKAQLLQAQKDGAEAAASCGLSTDGKPLLTASEKPSSLPLNMINPLSVIAASKDKVTPQQALAQTMAAMQKKAQELTGVAIPNYYNPAAVNPLKYAEQLKKRKLLWSKAGKEPEKVTEETKTAQWTSTSFVADEGGKTAAKFRKLMGIKEEEASAMMTGDVDLDKLTEEQRQKQDELFRQLDKEYAFARMATHTHRGVGLGFQSQGMPDT